MLPAIILEAASLLILEKEVEKNAKLIYKLYSLKNTINSIKEFLEEEKDLYDYNEETDKIF